MPRGILAVEWIVGWVLACDFMFSICGQDLP